MPPTTTETARLLTERELRERLDGWAAIEHGSASPGERAVANMLADELRGLGLEVRIEEERAHGTYWWPLGILLAAALGSLFGRRGLRLTGSRFSAGFAAAMADIGMRDVVPGANDNLTGVAAVMSVATALAAEPPTYTRVILLFPGSEESFQEGM